MIISRKPVSLVEVQEIVSGLDEKDALKDYLKKFVKISKTDAKKLHEELEALNNPKINDETSVKIADFLPREQRDLNKIFSETSLTEEETNAILEIVRKY